MIVFRNYSKTYLDLQELHKGLGTTEIN